MNLEGAESQMPLKSFSPAQHVHTVNKKCFFQRKYWATGDNQDYSVLKIYLDNKVWPTINYQHQPVN